nr:receptor-mediated endocytosis protein 6 homolog isoform X1 [Onthophagus taurus]
MDEIFGKINVLPELIDKLRQERLLVTEEKRAIQNLNERINECINSLAQRAWVNSQQRVNLNSSNRGDFTMEQCYRRSKYVNSTNFVQAKQIIDQQIILQYGEFFKLLKNQPEQLAHWIVMGEKLLSGGQETNHFEVLHSVITGLYGCLLLPEDVNLTLILLKQLAYLQLVSCDNPRRLLRQGSCSFAKMYYLFHENLHSARLFLLSTLQSSIIKLIANSDYYLDIDPDKTMARFTTGEALEKFGTIGSKEYEKKVSEYRTRIVNTFLELTNSFVLSLQDNLQCFPTSIGWLIWQIGKMMSKSFGENSKEVNAIATDLIFTSFICPAIVNPEYYGISDAPISEIARHNLIQIAQILQTLALYRYEVPDRKLHDLYGLLFTDNNSTIVADIVDSLLHQRCSMEDNPPPFQSIPGVNKPFVLFTEQELFNLTSFLQKVHTDNSSQPTLNNGLSYDRDATSLDHLIALLLNLSESLGHILHQSFRSIPNSPNGISKRNILNRAKSLRSPSNPTEFTSPLVLIIPINYEETYPFGLLSEQKVLNMHTCLGKDVPTLPNGDLTTGQEKRTRFSISHDDGSIGNTSDNLEAISEAASNHSADSSLEIMENEEDHNDQDNLSDMVSANVSGRGSPNISGRDTPSSQVTENEDAVRQPAGEVRHQEGFMERPSRNRITVKQIRSEIDDKFCKFEIKKLLEGDETVSIISDTWSTDVLASDSETLDASDNQNHVNFSPIIERQQDNLGNNPLLDISETHSESAWSTDVLASDTERLAEVDNDDVASVAPSDDTASVARSDDVAASGADFEENANGIINDRRSSAPGSATNYDEFHDLIGKQENNSPGGGGYPIKTGTIEYNNNDVLFSTGRDVLDSSIMKINDLQNALLTKRINKSTSEESMSSGGAIPKTIRKKYDDDMQLSNSSLNSSSSGGSSSSENNRAKKPEQPPPPWKTKIWQQNNGSETPSSNVTSTPSESTSELSSVMSTSTLVSPTIGNIFLDRKSATLNPKILKPTVSTGAIPKSISFDTTADKNYKEAIEDEQKKRGGGSGFFGKFKMGFRSRRGLKAYRSDEFGVRFGNGDGNHHHHREDDNNRTGFVYYPKKDASGGDTSEDILAKYRSKSNNEINNHNNVAIKTKPIEIVNDRDLKIDYNMNNDFMHTDCKRKLRLVLSTSQEQHYSVFQENSNGDVKRYLQVFLRLELAKAKSLKQWSVVARTAEALRCVQTLDSVACCKLFEVLREEYRQRSVYIDYLQKSKQLLLGTEAYLLVLQQELQSDKDLCESNLIETCVKLFLEKQECEIRTFCEEFRTLTLVDEKNDLLTSFLEELYAILRKDLLFQDSTSAQIELAFEAIEECVITKVYSHALYPNGDGDRHRDELLQDHLKKLSTIITPNHKDVLINKIYLNECPWLPAQEALQTMAAYKTPKDKVDCVVRCATAIMDLLSLAQERGSTAADDFTPVLVYVIIMVNPRDLLSTIQYVNSFYGNQITGEDEYWWTQFCSAVEHTKTMDYSY